MSYMDKAYVAQAKRLNRMPINQVALGLLKKMKEPANPQTLYVLQFLQEALGRDLVE